MFNKQYVIMAILSAGLLMFGGQVFADDIIPGVLCEYKLTNSTGGVAKAKVRIYESFLEVRVAKAQPNTLYTVWVDFRNRAQGKVLSGDYPLAKGATQNGVAPAFASTAPVWAGMDLDLNGMITDDEGDARLSTVLHYDLLQPGDSPVVGLELTMQGLNRVGGYWLRVYPVDPSVAASRQIVDGGEEIPFVVRATAQGITIVRHLDKITHGHTPGEKNVDFVSAFGADFPGDCLPPPPSELLP